MSKILFVYPSTDSLGLQQVMRLEPITLEYLAAGISDRHEVKIIDLRIPKENLSDTIREWGPDYVGITGFTLHVPEMLSLSKLVKGISQDIKVMVGGHHATFMPESFMVPTIDIIGRGECESVIETMLDGKLTTIPGLLYKRNSQWMENTGEPPSIFPRLTPAHHLVAQYSGYYHVFNVSCVGTQVSRGCPYSCSFCDSEKFFHRRYQMRDPHIVAEELEKSPQRVVFPVDENIGINSKFLATLLVELSIRNLHKRYLFTTSVRDILRNKDVLDRWFDIGLRAFFIGVERIDDEGIANLGKRTTVAMNDAAINFVHSRGGIVIGSFIILPTDTEDYFKRLEEYVQTRKIEVPMFCILTPFPGTDCWTEYNELSNDLSKYDLLHAVVPTYLPEVEFYRHFQHLYTTMNLKRLVWGLLKQFGVGSWLFKLPRIRATMKALEGR